MTIVVNIRQGGQPLTGSLNGRIQLDEGRGRFVVNDNTGTERTVMDLDGLHANNANGVELTTVDTAGVTVGTPAERRARLGYHPDGTRINVWVSPEGTDVINKLRSEG